MSLPYSHSALREVRASRSGLRSGRGSTRTGQRFRDRPRAPPAPTAPTGARRRRGRCCSPEAAGRRTAAGPCQTGERGASSCRTADLARLARDNLAARTGGHRKLWARARSIIEVWPDWSDLVDDLAGDDGRPAGAPPADRTAMSNQAVTASKRSAGASQPRSRDRCRTSVPASPWARRTSLTSPSASSTATMRRLTATGSLSARLTSTGSRNSIRRSARPSLRKMASSSLEHQAGAPAEAPALGPERCDGRERDVRPREVAHPQL